MTDTFAATALADPPGLKAAAARVGEVSTLPQLAMRIIQVINDPRSSAVDVKGVLEADPALCARVLRLINSAWFGLRREVRNVQQAISLLGFGQIRNLAITMSVSEVFRKELRIGGYSRRALWRHMVSVAIGARMVAARCRLVNFEDAYLAGLLHDLGIILLDQYLHVEFREILKRLDGVRLLTTVENDLLGFNHAQLGATVADGWKFTPTVVSAIRHHHGAHLAPAADLPIVAAVEIANLLCGTKGLLSVGVPTTANPERSTFAALGIGRDDYRVLWEDLDQELASADSLIALQ